MELGLSLGTNEGDRLRNLQDCVGRLADLPDVVLTARSPAYETEPVDVAEEYLEQLFVNAVVVIETERDPHELLAVFRSIESEMGRARTSDRNAPRPIDIDIIYAGLMEFSDEQLTVPHPRCAKRMFVLKPLNDVRPGLVLPGMRVPVRQLLLSLPDTKNVVLLAREW